MLPWHHWLQRILTKTTTQATARMCLSGVLKVRKFSIRSRLARFGAEVDKLYFGTPSGIGPGGRSRNALKLEIAELITELTRRHGQMYLLSKWLAVVPWLGDAAMRLQNHARWVLLTME